MPLIIFIVLSVLFYFNIKIVMFTISYICILYFNIYAHFAGGITILQIKITTYRATLDNRYK